MYLGVVDEDAINNMSFVFFNNVLSFIGKKLNFESISNLFGNSFAKDAGEIINSCNPMIKLQKRSMFDSLDVKIEENKKKEEEIFTAFDDIENAFLNQ